MRRLILLFNLLLIVVAAASQNPITPAGVYFADPSARVWNSRLYLYGSLDESCEYYCSKRHHVLETRDMKTWLIHENVFSSEGEGDDVPYNDVLLFAPDCAYSRDSFYLYYCQPSGTQAEGVAVSSSPVGPFTNGRLMNTGIHQEIDPSVFIDDDGLVYYLWGQFSLKMAVLRPGMREIDTSTLRTGIITEKEHYFHEGAYLTKRNGIYYLVYADISRGEKPTCIGYATSTSPFGPYTYGGVIVDNDECNPGNWNNHGSLAEYKGQWYVFYHRSTHGCDKMRKACVEPVFFNEDGSIPEVEMTSQGASGPISATARIEAEQACILHGNVRVQAFSPFEEELALMADNDKALFRYLEFSGKETKITLRLAPGKDGGNIVVSLDKPWHKRLADIRIDGSENENQWKTLSFDIPETAGVHSLYFQFYGNGSDMFKLDWFRFE